MKTVFTNSSRQQCIFTDEAVIFAGPNEEVCFPYGCLDSVKMSLMGVLQAASRKTICSFPVDRRDRAAAKEMIKYARNAMTSAPEASVQIIDKTKAAQVSGELSPEEQLRQYKALFVQGAISKEEFDLKKKILGNQ